MSETEQAADLTVNTLTAGLPAKKPRARGKNYHEVVARRKRGVLPSAIVKELGLTRQRVYQLIRDATRVGELP